MAFGEIQQDVSCAGPVGERTMIIFVILQLPLHYIITVNRNSTINEKQF